MTYQEEEQYKKNLVNLIKDNKEKILEENDHKDEKYEKEKIEYEKDNPKRL